MGQHITLKASDGVEIGAWRADPKGKPRGGVVVIQEIMGVNAHIRSVADFYASQGYLAIAPAIFDRVQPNYEAGYEPADMQNGMAIAGKLDRQKSALDVAAAIAVASEAGKVGIVGYCLGGTIAWIAACGIDGLSAASCYYGGGVLALGAQEPRVPTIMHFGSKDGHIPVDGVKSFAAAHPGLPVYLYDAGHAFNRDGNSAYDAPTAELARKRTLDLFAAELG